MAIYKIFPKADASIYSSKPQKNTGLDEILEVTVKNQLEEGDEDIRRTLIIFNDEDITLVRSKITGSWASNLRLYLAKAENLNLDYNLEIRQVSQSWDMGTGQWGDDPETRNGVCWYSTSASLYSTSSNWNPSEFYTVSGGGSWTNLYATCSFNNQSNKDINCNVSNIVDSWFSGSQNNGFIIKHPIAFERDSGSYMALSFFSVDTHTIFPPCLEFKWDDSVWATGSLSVISNDQFVITCANIIEKYKADTFYKFRINARDKFPVRIFTTSSLYTVNKYLPQNSYWAIQDYKTEEMVVDFDNNYTKISADQNGSYFNFYMNGLEPERSYKILIKTNLANGESIIVDNNLIFKIVR